MAQLGSDILLQKVVCRRLPYSNSALSIDDVTKHVECFLDSWTSHADEPSTIRVSARPKKIESNVCTSLKPERLSPARFTHTLSIVPTQASSVHFSYLFAIMPRHILDPTAWTETHNQPDAHPAYRRFVEVSLRWPQRLLGVTSVVLWIDSCTTEGCDWLLHWAGEYASDKVGCSVLSPNGEDSAWKSGWGGIITNISELNHTTLRHFSTLNEGKQPHTLFLLDLSCSGDQAITSIHSLITVCLTAKLPSMADSGTGILRLRCGRRLQALQKWTRETVRRFELELGASRVELLHLLCDRDTERTIVFQWSGVPPTCSEMRKSPNDDCQSSS